MYKINEELEAYYTTKLNEPVSIKTKSDFLHIHPSSNKFQIKNKVSQFILVEILYYVFN